MTVVAQCRSQCNCVSSYNGSMSFEQAIFLLGQCNAKLIARQFIE